MKLVSKERISSKVKRKCDETKTPYQRLIESGQISEEVKQELEGIYLSLDPNESNRTIGAKQSQL